MENTTSSAVTGRPSCQRAPGRSEKRHVSESTRSHRSASAGRKLAASMVAPPGSRARGLLSVMVEAQADAELLFHVPPSCFAPPPKVTSAVVRLWMHPAAVPAQVLARAVELSGEAFTHRRKQLANALGGGLDRDEVNHRLQAIGLDPTMRPQEVPLGGWLALAGVFPLRRHEEA